MSFKLMRSASFGFLLLHVVSGLDNGLGLKPPLGWQSFVYFHCDFNETVIRRQVDTLISRGFTKVGYEYIVIGDCWMSTSRDANGDLQADPAKFPTGMSSLIDYVHKVGLKFGLYLSAGTKSCSKIPKPGEPKDGWGSFGNEVRDANFVAGVGADYLFYDGVCYVPKPPAGVERMDWQKSIVSKMGQALNATGRPMYYAYGSAYEWNKPYIATVPWVAEPKAENGGVNDYRSSFDIGDSWDLVQQQINGLWGEQRWADAGLTKPGSWASYDKLEIGNGKPNKTSGTGLTTMQSRTYFSWWAIANAPLLMTCDLPSLDEDLAEIMRNPEVIAIDQDFVDGVGRRVTSPLTKYGEVWAKKLASGAAAAFIRGQTAPAQNVTVFFQDVGLQPSTRACVRDASRRKDLGQFVGSYTSSLELGDSELLVITPVTDVAAQVDVLV